MSDYENQENSLAKNYNLVSIFKFTFPTMFMMLFNGLYSVVDIAFVSNYVNTNALSAINIVSPMIGFLWGLGSMLATGGGAIIAKKMGEGNEGESRNNFSFVVCVGILVGIFISILGLIFVDNISKMLGASDALLPYCRDYLGILILFTPAILLQVLFQNLFVTAGKPSLGMILMICAGVTNVVLDYISIVHLDMGIKGAAIATGIGYSIPAIAGIFLFNNRKGTLYFDKPKMKIKEFIFCIYNGSSEMVQLLSIGITTFLFNVNMMRLSKEAGVAAITIITNTQYLLATLTIGFAMGVAPILSYNYGAKNAVKLNRIIKLSLLIISILGVLVFSLGMFASPIITALFSKEGSDVYSITLDGFRIYSFTFLFNGFSIFITSLFTALSNGKISVILSLIKTFGLLTVMLLVLPKIIGITGVWIAAPIAEAISMFIGFVFIHKFTNLNK